MKELKFTNVGKEYTEGNEAKLLKEVESFDWINLPVKDLPMGQGMALEGVIKEWKIPAKRVSIYGGFCGFGCYGVETEQQQIFFLDLGTHVTPLALRDLQ